MSEAARNRSPEARAKQAASLKGKMAGSKNPNYGRTHTPEAKAKISAARKEKGATWKGGKHSPEAIERMREIAANRGPEHYAKVWEARRAKKL